jgi:citrate synthase
MQEIEYNKARCQELIDKVLQRSQVVLDGFHRVMSSPRKDHLKEMEGKLTEYKKCVLLPVMS